MKKLRYSLAALVIAFGLLACARAGAAEGIVGKWKLEVRDQTIQAEFKADGTGNLAGQAFTYKTGSGKLTITYAKGNTETFGYAATGGALTLSKGGQTQTFKRVGGSGGAMAGAKTPGVEIYTFKADKTARIGYPKGWKVTEQNMPGMLAAMIQEKKGKDSAGVMIFVMPIAGEAAVKTGKDLSKALLGTLRQQMLPDLKIGKQAPHPQAKEVFTSEITATSDGVVFKGLAWCAVAPATPKLKIGVFALFSAPQKRYGQFNGPLTLATVLAPLFGASPPSPAAGAKASTLAGAKGVGKIVFIRLEGKDRVLCALDPTSGKVARLYNFKNLPICQPTRSVDGKTLLLAVPAMKQVMCVTGITSYDENFKKGVVAFPMKFPMKGEAYVTWPSISRDGKLVAVRATTFQNAGKINVHEATSGAYSHTFVGVLVRGRLSCFGINEKVRERTLYHQDPELPDISGHRRGWCGVFSPTGDILAYTNGGKIRLAHARTGKKLREFKQGTGIYGQSGLAFSPDGKLLAYIGSFGMADTPGVVVLTDVASGASKDVKLPATVRPCSLARAGSSSASICLDFSPDGRYIVFSGTARVAAEKDSAVELFRSMAGTAPTRSDIYVLDLKSGKCARLTSDGKSFDPVWKGR